MEKKYTALVLYHSNTGNTAKLAKQAVNALKKQGWEAHQAALGRSQKNLPLEKPDLVLVGSPIHFWQAPVPVISMIRSLPRFEGAKGFVFMTYGTVFDGDAPYQVARELEGLGVGVVGGASILSPHNFKTKGGKRLGDVFEDFGKGQPNGKVLAEFRKTVRAAAAKVESGVNGFDISAMRSPKPVITFLDGLMPVGMQRSALPKVKWDEETCTQCGKCVAQCTTGSIRKENGRIVTENKTCYRCYQCLWTCPAQARSADLAAAAGLLRGLKKVIKNPGSRFFV